ESGGGGPSAETWALRGGRWHPRTPGSERPRPRADHALAYDAARARVVLFGGSGGSGGGALADTWEWDGAGRTERDTSMRAPPPRRGAGMAYDAGRARDVLFGGAGPEVFEWDGARWEVRSSTAPGPAGSVPAPL